MNEQLEKRVGDLEHAMNGNGTEGLKTRFARLEEKMKSGIALQKWQMGILVAYVTWEKGSVFVKTIIANI